MAGRTGRSPQPAAPARKNKSGPGRRPEKPTLVGRIFARPGMVVAGAAFAAVMTGIVANALLLQKGHHPSPLFGTAPAETAAVPSPPAVPVPPPAPRQALAQPEAPAAEPASAEVPAEADPAPPPASAPQPARAAKKPAAHQPSTHAAPHVATASHKAATHPDLIGQLLGRQDSKLR